MMLVSFGPAGAETPAVLVDEERLMPVAPILASHGLRANDWSELLGIWPAVEPVLREAIARGSESTILRSSVRLGPPVARPATVIAIGFNYSTHGADVLGAPPPVGEPIVFLKPVTALSGPEDPIVLPPETSQLDYEIELAVVIGRGGRRIASADAAQHIAGYMVANDVSARDVAFGPGIEHPLLFQIARAKGFPTFCPTGPWLLTADEVPDASSLGMRLSVNGEVRQRATTAQMTVGVADLIASVSATMELRPGDILLTGTPPGCGFQQDPPSYLRHGDAIEATIDRLGVMRTPVNAESVPELRV
ncbi:MAG TPA: fumarylacetoacetate hydrolase family protein [Microbacterium sp.]|nr:fumarylacetoacetate hydrolase family protein [Microbacterium sp.]